MATAAPLDRSGSASFAIPDIVNMASDGSIRVPTFQRPFVWDAKDVRDLFDSLYRGFPIGTLLLWQHRAPAGKVTLGPITLDVVENPSALWVVDGQQRITSLFASLSPEHKGIDERFEVYFDLATEKFVNPRRGVSRLAPFRYGWHLSRDRWCTGYATTTMSWSPMISMSQIASVAHCATTRYPPILSQGMIRRYYVRYSTGPIRQESRSRAPRSFTPCSPMMKCPAARARSFGDCDPSVSVILARVG